LDKLEEKGIDWNHRSGEITLKGDLVGHTWKIHHQYVIEQNASYHAVLATSAWQPKTSRSCSHIASWATSKLWHWRMGHVGPGALSQLGSQTLGVRMQDPSTVECPDCTLLKITQQISQKLNSNKSIKPFHKIYIDWFDLEQGWDHYQSERRLIYQCLILTCEATDIVLTYFTTYSKEDENLLILQDAVNFLQIRYNLKVKIV
jgi:hypothetical protein